MSGQKQFYSFFRFISIYHLARITLPKKSKSTKYLLKQNVKGNFFEELLWKVPSKIYKVNLLWKKMEKKNGLLLFPNISTEQWGYSL